MPLQSGRGWASFVDGLPSAEAPDGSRWAPVPAGRGWLQDAAGIGIGLRGQGEGAKIQPYLSILLTRPKVFAP